MKTTLTAFILAWTLAGQARINLDYEPKGIIILFDFDSLKIYTDTLSVLELVNSYQDSSYKARTKNLILKEISKSIHDTIVFKG